MNTTVILPTYNESENIGELIEALQKIFKKIKTHKMSILVVDDNSPDGTADIVKNKQKKYNNIHLITGKKEGLGKAYLRGMDYASKNLKAEVMFEMDADFSHDPKIIPDFLKKIDQGYDLVIGSRYIKGGSIPENWGLHRKILSITGNLIVRTALFNFSHHEWTNGYRAIRTPLYKKIRTQLENFKGYTFQVSFLHKAFQQGAKITEVPNNFVDRVRGKSKIGSEYIINLLSYLILTNIQNPPRVFKFLVVGTIGFIINTVIFELMRTSIDPSLAGAAGAELAIISNFILNNFWTFSDVPLPLPQIPKKFLVFNVGSLGSVVIQATSIKLFILFLGSAANIQRAGYITGVLVGLFWNYTIYSKVVWKKKPGIVTS